MSRSLMLLGAALLGVSQQLLAERPVPCQSAYMGAKFGASIVEISTATSALKLMDGSENPKLKRLLEWSLLVAIHSARVAVNEGAEVDPVALPMVLPNFIGVVERGRAMVVARKLDANPPTPGDETRHPLEDLDVISSWLAKQGATESNR